MRLAPVSWLSGSFREVTVKGFLCTDQQLFFYSGLDISHFVAMCTRRV